jgi:hypothetical protein
MNHHIPGTPDSLSTRATARLKARAKTGMSGSISRPADPPEPSCAFSSTKEIVRCFFANAMIALKNILDVRVGGVVRYARRLLVGAGLRTRRR